MFVSTNWTTILVALTLSPAVHQLIDSLQISRASVTSQRPPTWSGASRGRLILRTVAIPVTQVTIVLRFGTQRWLGDGTDGGRPANSGRTRWPNNRGAQSPPARGGPTSVTRMLMHPSAASSRGTGGAPKPPRALQRQRAPRLFRPSLAAGRRQFRRRALQRSTRPDHSYRRAISVT